MKDDYVLLAVKIFHNLFMPMMCLSYEVFFTYEINIASFVCPVSPLSFGLYQRNSAQIYHLRWFTPTEELTPYSSSSAMFL